MASTLKFRQICEVLDDIFAVRGASVLYEASLEDGLSLRLAYEQHPHAAKQVLTCSAIVDAEESPKVERVLRILREIQDGEVPDDVTVRPPPPAIYPADEARQREAYPLSAFPEWFQECVTSCTRRAYSLIGGVVSLHRWRNGIECRHNLLAPLDTSWSNDGAHWYPLPIEGSVSIRASIPSHSIDATSWRELCQAVATGVREPVAYELWLEARALSGQNPRSSLVICAASVETGVKNFIAERVPQARWLLLNLPTPPIDQLVKYLRDFDVKVPATMLESMRRLFKERNDIVHTGAVKMRRGQPSSDGLEMYLVNGTRLSVLARLPSRE